MEFSKDQIISAELSKDHIDLLTSLAKMKNPSKKDLDSWYNYWGMYLASDIIENGFYCYICNHVILYDKNLRQEGFGDGHLTIKNHAIKHLTESELLSFI